MGRESGRARLDEAATQALVAEIEMIRADDSRTVFERRQALARRLGAAHDPDSGLTTFGFWAPELAAARVSEHEVSLELFTALEPLDLAASRLATTMRRERVPLVCRGDYWWGVVDGVAAGCADRPGALYWLRGRDEGGREVLARDLLAWSIPYGAFAPAEVYDVVSLERERGDLAHFASAPRPPSAILELHVPTATAEGSLGALAAVYRDIGERLRRGETLPPELAVYAGYDALQPLPVEPTVERRGHGESFAVTDTVDALEGICGVLLRHPENRNWGYDNIVLASSALNPTILGTRRPDELVALAEALHALPEPMMLVHDIVYGHADNQALEVLPSRFFKGPNMYGQDLNHQDPTVRAILLEMQRRRLAFGCDGLRVDGAQDFRFYNPRTGEVEHDDDYLQSMSDVEQEIGPHRRRMWMIFEDGRPWPREDWETASTYRDVIERQPEVWQWGPLIFAHNTPMLDRFWSERWWRVEQVWRHGARWIGGCANHDTVRRGTQVDPALGLNAHLGDDLPDILARAYDNPAIALLAYALLPGIPMDFLNAAVRAPWAFMRTTDDLYDVKVMAEEARFMRWAVRDEDYSAVGNFRRTKRHGFAARVELADFLERLAALVESSAYDLERIAEALVDTALPVSGRAGLHLLAQDWMNDVHDYCNVAPHLDALDAEHVAFCAALREFRGEERWLADDAGPEDRLAKIDAEDDIVYHGSRRSPDGATRVAVVARMQGPPTTLDPAALWPELDLARASETRLGAGAAFDADGRLSLVDGAGALFVWRR